ncbi:MAG TPA: pyridoxamine 5'-phosphate oxidase family protein [Phycisphaerales bacterium]|nr:pyridoxamine 5'-phosphate oxidase family protein [Phycisphaerales bacterium]
MPFDHIPDFAWAALKRGADDPTHPMHLLTMATVGPDGRPSARLMTNRGADQTGPIARLWFHTDSHTPKVGELHTSPFACLTAWDAAGGIHLRLHGRVTIHQHDECSRRHWEQLSSAARWLYSATDRPADNSPVPIAAPEPPDLRLPRDKRQLPHKLTARERDRFVVIEVRVETIDWLQATQAEQRRAVLRADERWIAQPA